MSVTSSDEQEYTLDEIMAEFKEEGAGAKPEPHPAAAPQEANTAAEERRSAALSSAPDEESARFAEPPAESRRGRVISFSGHSRGKRRHVPEHCRGDAADDSSTPQQTPPEDAAAPHRVAKEKDLDEERTPELPRPAAHAGDTAVPPPKMRAQTLPILEIAEEPPVESVAAAPVAEEVEPILVSPASEEDRAKNQGSAPWRTTRCRPEKRESEPEDQAGTAIGTLSPQLQDELLPEADEKPKRRRKKQKPTYVEPEEEEIEEEPQPPKKRLPYDRINLPTDDPSQKAAELGKRISSMAARLLLFVPLIVVSLYLALSQQYALPMPMGFSYQVYPTIYLGIWMACQVGALLLAKEVTFSGIWRLLRGRPTLDSMVVVSSMAALAHCGSMLLFPQWGTAMPYSCAAVVTCFFALLAKRQRYETLRRNYKAVTMAASPIGVKLHSDGKLEAAAVKTQVGVEPELEALSAPDLTERMAAFYAPVALAACLAFALVASVVQTKGVFFLWCFAAVTSVTAPICLLLSSSAGAKKLSRKLYTSGSMLLNPQCADKLAKCKYAVLRDADLYPAGTVKITGMKIAENQEPEVVVACAASLLQEVGGGLGRAFAEFARQQYLVPARAREMRFFENRGMSAMVAGRYVQMGTSAYLIRMGIRVTEGLKLKNSLFVAIDSQFSGIFSMKYEVQTPVYAAFGLLRQARVRPVAALRDPTLTQSLVESRFELRKNAVLYPSLEDRMQYSSQNFSREDPALALLSRNGLMPLAEVLTAAKKLRRSAMSGCVMGMVCASVGMLILYFLVSQGAVEAASPINVLLYLLLWALPAQLSRVIITRL